MTARHLYDYILKEESYSFQSAAKGEFRNISIARGNLHALLYCLPESAHVHHWQALRDAERQPAEKMVDVKFYVPKNTISKQEIQDAVMLLLVTCVGGSGADIVKIRLGLINDILKYKIHCTKVDDKHVSYKMPDFLGGKDLVLNNEELMQQGIKLAQWGKEQLALEKKAP